jgi:hypothetical protein
MGGMPPHSATLPRRTPSEYTPLEYSGRAGQAGQALGAASTVRLPDSLLEPLVDFGQDLLSLCLGQA